MRTLASWTASLALVFSLGWTAEHCVTFDQGRALLQVAQAEERELQAHHHPSGHEHQEPETPAPTPTNLQAHHHPSGHEHQEPETPAPAPAELQAHHHPSGHEHQHPEEEAEQAPKDCHYCQTPTGSELALFSLPLPEVRTIANGPVPQAQVGFQEVVSSHFSRGPPRA